MKKIFCLLFVLLLFVKGYCQETYKFRTELDEALKKEIVKHADSLFLFEVNINNNFTTNHVYAYKYLEKEEMLQPDYLEGQLKKLKESPDNAFVYSNIALFYQRRGDTLLAKEYYTKALANHKLESNVKDSAFYYSYRGIIKNNLKQNGIEDMEKALSINKADSTAIAFYPMLLIFKGDFDKAKTVLTAALQAKKNNYNAYLMLVIANFYQTFTTLGVSPEEAHKIKEKDIDKIIDFSIYDSYIDKDNKLFRQIKEMGQVFNVFIKFSEGLNSSWQPSKKDIAFVEARERYLKNLLTDKNTNAYGVYMALGTLNLLQKKFTEAEVCYNKALLVFPKEKESYDFNVLECYDNLAVAYYMNKKIDRALHVVTKGLEVKSVNKEKKKSLLLNQARLTAQMENFDKANDIALEAKELGEDFDIDFLLSYLSAKSNLGTLGQRYLDKAQKYIITEEQYCRVLTYMSLFHIINGSPDGARSFFDENKKLLVNEKCEDCEKLLEKYLIVND